MPNHFLDLDTLNADTLHSLLKRAKQLKAENLAGKTHHLLSGKHLAMIFEKASTRTRVSFEVGINQLGGQAVVLSAADSQLGRGETTADTARVLSRYVDLIMIRTFKHDTLAELAKHATVPVINGLTDFSHPCQIMTDILTVEETFGSIVGKKIAWVGDFNNVAMSWAHAAEKLGFTLHIACPEELWATGSFSQHVTVSANAEEAVAGADVVTTDTWLSMGDVDGEYKLAMLKPYQVNEELMRRAKSEAIFLHCLPAHREEEVTAAVIDGPQSKVWDEAENRLHMQKAIMLWCLGK
jgi:ornithine carbamoyltransferase